MEIFRLFFHHEIQISKFIIYVRMEWEKNIARIWTKLIQVVDFELKTHLTKFCTPSSNEDKAMGPQSGGHFISNVVFCHLHTAKYGRFKFLRLPSAFSLRSKITFGSLTKTLMKSYRWKKSRFFCFKKMQLKGLLR